MDNNNVPSTSQQNITNENCTILKQINVAGNYVYKGNPSPENAQVQDIATQLPKLPNLIKSFRGRKEEIKQLDTWLFKEDKRMVTICGLPGFGKSELAIKFAQTCKKSNKIKMIVWIQATTKDNLHHSLRKLAKNLNLYDVDDTINDTIEKITNSFNGTRTMFIFDDAENRQSLKDFETPSDCYCLFTSHEEDWGDDIPSLKLTPLDPDAAVDVIRSILNSYLDIADDDLLYELVQVLECVPLAVQLAAAYIREEKNLTWTPHDFLVRLVCSYFS